LRARSGTDDVDSFKVVEGLRQPLTIERDIGDYSDTDHAQFSPRRSKDLESTDSNGNSLACSEQNYYFGTALSTVSTCTPALPDQPLVPAPRELRSGLLGSNVRRRERFKPLDARSRSSCGSR